MNLDFVLSPIFTLLSLLTSFGLAFWGVYLNIKSRTYPKLSYSEISSTLLSEFDDELQNSIEVKFNGEKIDRLTSTIFYIWNSGNKVLRNSDIASTSPLLISLSAPAQILTVQLKKQSRQVNNVHLKKGESKNEFIIYFDFLEKNEGCVYNIIHNGNQKDLNLKGAIIGSPRSPIYVKHINEINLGSLKETHPLTHFIMHCIFLFMTIFTLLSIYLAYYNAFNIGFLRAVTSDSLRIALTFIPFCITVPIIYYIINFLIIKIPRHLKDDN